MNGYFASACESVCTVWLINGDIVLQDIDKCIAILDELNQLQINAFSLKKNPDIVGTIKKVRTLTSQ